MKPFNNKSFPTTHWSVVIGADAANEKAARDSLEALCRMYWYPLYAYARQGGHSHHEAEDQTQAFLAHLIANHRIGQASPQKGRFRAFLLTAFRNFLIDDWRRANSQRKGGHFKLESIEFEKGAERFTREPIDPGTTPAQAYDQAWARSLIQHAKKELQAEYASSGRGDIFETLEPILLEHPGSVPLASHAENLGISTHALSEALRRARLRLGNHVAIRIMETVPDRKHAEEELRHLIEACQGLSGLV